MSNIQCLSMYVCMLAGRGGEREEASLLNSYGALYTKREVPIY